jgi:cytochrome c553
MFDGGRTMSTYHTSTWLLCVATLACAAGAAAAGETVDFSRDIRPILATHCYNCHGRDAHSRQADLRLDDREAASRELPSGMRALVPGSVAESELVARIEATDPDTVMPPPEFKKPLTKRQIELLKAWVAANAPYSPHWSFAPVADPPVPADPADAALTDWPADPLDRFVLDRLTKEGLRPAPPADRETWLRRVSLDLTGLPPSPEERAAFLADGSPSARERVVDRLLASPRHAEKMAMQWLDVARYADTNGYNNDEERTQWPWRDWVIRAFARNLPYDQFVIEQLAGDLLPSPTRDQRIATAFGRNHVLTTEGGVIHEEYRVEYVADRIQTVGTAFMGLTLQCARCHDHKFDPVAQREYFQLFAFFNSIPDPLPQYAKGKLVNVVEPFVHLRSHADEAALAAIRDRLGDAKPEGETAKQIEAIEDRTVKVMVMADLPEPRPAYLLDRGQYDARRDEVEPAVPAFLPPLPEGAAKNRLTLARWLVDPRHPLTARVAVNRWWEMLFGRGLVETAEDFGTQGSTPTHQDLLDHLATSLVRGGWDVRALLKRIVLSATYGQSSRAAPESFARDPDNRLLARGPRFRLPAEMVRDQALFASGLLVERVGGPSVKPYQPAGLWEEVSVLHQAAYVPDAGDGLFRRSMYTFWKRTCPPPSMAIFDAPDRETCVVRRARTNTPLQALVVMNDPTYIEAAKALAARSLATGPEADAAVVARMVQLLLGREPSADERAVLAAKAAEFRGHFAADPAAARKFLAAGADADLEAPADLAAWTMVASTLLCLDETLTKE